MSYLPTMAKGCLLAILMAVSCPLRSEAQTGFAPVKPGDVTGSILPKPLNQSAVTGQLGSLAPSVGNGPGNAGAAKGVLANETIAKFVTGKQQTRAQDAVSNLSKAAESLPRR